MNNLVIPMILEMTVGQNIQNTLDNTLSQWYSNVRVTKVKIEVIFKSSILKVVIQEINS